MIFSRRGAGRHAKAGEPQTRASRRAALLEDLDLAGPADDAQGAVEADQALGDGPYDFEDAPAGNRLDLGSLLVPAVDGVEIRVQTGDNGVVQQIALVDGDNALQLGVFAAPRSDGLWDEVRAEIRKSLFDDGVGAEEVDGRWGVELRARVRTPEGLSDLRFVGIDGPRWMVRAVFQGPAAADPAVGGVLNDCLTDLVVRRDDQARPTREPLPLRLPPEMALPQGEGVVPAAPAAQEAPRRKPSPRPRRD